MTCRLQHVLGKVVRRPASVDQCLVNELMGCYRPRNDEFDVIAATTMCANDFYEGEFRAVFIVWV